ncbi:hypothetical protein AB0K40_45555 [Nonomuraea bangladeshensis]|uniref:Uncharacterized protein n=1 Tax=Nonomuraea bangladeshensis TaxID=404385 RepID=A0ABV3HJY1_9ACTN
MRDTTMTSWILDLGLVAVLIMGNWLIELAAGAAPAARQDGENSWPST